MENGKRIQIKASAPVAYLSDVEAVMFLRFIMVSVLRFMFECLLFVLLWSSVLPCDG